MLNIAVFFGGKSVEHDVSIITGRQVLNNIDSTKYNVFPIYIDKTNKWWTGNDLDLQQTYLPFVEKKHKRISIISGENVLIVKSGLKQKKIKIDCAFNCCHGTYGEDGNLQGLLNCLSIPFTGSDTLASSICMNKIIMKRLFERYNFPIPKYICLNREHIMNYENIKLKFPLIVKPANLGSSIGISRVDNKEELFKALETAFHFDGEVIIEEAVQNLREINCSVQKIKDEIVTSDLEEPVSWEKFLSFDDKYVQKGKKSGQKRKINVKIGKRLENKIRNISKMCYEHFNLSGAIRIDFLLDDLKKELFINEINTIPGSMAFYLWKGKEISFRKLIDLQIEQALLKEKQKSLNQTEFKSNILSQN